MAHTAQQLWHDLERTSGRTLLTRTGQVTLGSGAALDSIAAAMAAAGVAAQRLSAEEATQRFPTMSVGGPVLFEPHSGVLHAEACLEALCDTGDFELRTGAGATALDDRGGAGVIVRAKEEALRADLAVVCAGPRTLDLVGLRPPVAAPASFPQVAYVAPKDAGAPEQPPVFIEWGDDMIYGLPTPDDTDSGRPLFKVSHHTTGEPVAGFDPTDPSPLSDDAALLGLLRDAVARLLPSFDPEPVATERCVYDNSADTDFILDRAGRVVVGCGTSGHAFKFGPYLGELLADLAEDSAPAFVGERFGLSREVDAGTGAPPGAAAPEPPS
jgi:sarcosine oxidase